MFDIIKYIIMLNLCISLMVSSCKWDVNWFWEWEVDHPLKNRNYVETSSESLSNSLLNINNDELTVACDTEPAEGKSVFSHPPLPTSSN